MKTTWFMILAWVVGFCAMAPRLEARMEEQVTQAIDEQENTIADTGGGKQGSGGISCGFDVQATYRFTGPSNILYTLGTAENYDLTHTPGVTFTTCERSLLYYGTQFAIDTTNCLHPTPDMDGWYPFYGQVDFSTQSPGESDIALSCQCKEPQNNHHGLWARTTFMGPGVALQPSGTGWDSHPGQTGDAPGASSCVVVECKWKLSCGPIQPGG